MTILNSLKRRGGEEEKRRDEREKEAWKMNKHSVDTLKRRGERREEERERDIEIERVNRYNTRLNE